MNKPHEGDAHKLFQRSLKGLGHPMGLDVEEEGAELPPPPAPPDAQPEAPAEAPPAQEPELPLEEED